MAQCFTQRTMPNLPKAGLVYGIERRYDVRMQARSIPTPRQIGARMDPRTCGTPQAGIYTANAPPAKGTVI